MKLVVTIDVEEEGLFSNSYAARDVPVENVQALPCLNRVFQRWNIHPTLLVTHAVASNKNLQGLLVNLCDTWHGEIGAHLHHWNTPPFEELPYPQPVPSELMPEHLLTAKLQTLLESIREMGIVATSFRMGRFNLGPKMFSVLRKAGMLVDSSIAPMRRYYGGPDHLSVPIDPYFPDPSDPRRPGNSEILEAPLTILPVTSTLGSVLDSIKTNARIERRISWMAANLLSLPAQPLWTGLNRLKLAVRLHKMRGGRVLTVFFHSSELIPGGCPQHRTTEDVDRFLDKLDRFFAWLHQTYSLESITLSELGRLFASPRARDIVEH
ncbi:hypothetical protein [Desulfomonile tiedjei]|uniref:Deacetylase n=1 Tax=Desulfomonile tiedjei (strain ATCC 49306 / DSM 6799 / DCB-1) TaxID=706587 RepID=I4C410_DESTA|nr:hypothetical protein [Desulfomonile tiedjei]AFM24301.1 hypothetical protein Desti_1590 [Desulfomonile tiedjei DSM 6799]